MNAEGAMGHGIRCRACGGAFAAAAVSLCSCPAPHRTPECPACGSCLCAPQEPSRKPSGASASILWMAHSLNAKF